MTWTGERKARLPNNGPQIRRQILQRDEGICHVCRLPGADEVDHVVAGDNHAVENLAAIHDDPCHRAKSARKGNPLEFYSSASRELVLER